MVRIVIDWEAQLLPKCNENDRSQHSVSQINLKLQAKVACRCPGLCVSWYAEKERKEGTRREGRGKRGSLA